MSDLVEQEGRPGENMVRASVDSDLGHLILGSVPDPEARHLLEEAIVAHSHDMLEVGKTLGKEHGVAIGYIRGLFDMLKIY